MRRRNFFTLLGRLERATLADPPPEREFRTIQARPRTG